LRHLFPSDRIVDLIDAERGLTAAEVEDRRRRNGLNDILGDRHAGWRAMAHDTARDPMIWFLVATALLFAWLGDYAEAGVLSLALLPIASMDAYLHHRTRLAGRLAAYARVLRDGAAKKISSVELVPGDLVIDEAG
jgi:Ca2+-transporting ATPase